MVAPAVASAIVTDCVLVKLPAAGEKLGVATWTGGGGGVPELDPPPHPDRDAAMMQSAMAGRNLRRARDEGRVGRVCIIHLDKRLST